MSKPNNKNIINYEKEKTRTENLTDKYIKDGFDIYNPNIKPNLEKYNKNKIDLKNLESLDDEQLDILIFGLRSRLPLSKKKEIPENFKSISRKKKIELCKKYNLNLETNSSLLKKKNDEKKKSNEMKNSIRKFFKNSINKEKDKKITDLEKELERLKELLNKKK